MHSGCPPGGKTSREETLGFDNGHGRYANLSNKRSAKQSVENPAIQRFPDNFLFVDLTTIFAQCMKEGVRLNTEATKRGAKFPGADKSTKWKSPRQKQECDETSDEHNGSRSGFYYYLICFVLRNSRYDYHVPVLVQG